MNLAQLKQTLGIAVTPEMERVSQIFPVKVSRHYASLIDPAKGECDPIARQCLPDPAELADLDSSFDPLHEARQMPVPRLIRRFPDRAVLLASGKCATYCRFCFRKRLWRGGENLRDLTREELGQACRYLQEHPEIKEILISGGDPLMLDDDHFIDILNELDALPSLDILRIATRLIVTDPGQITEAKIAAIVKSQKTWIVTHFNHPAELHPAALAVCRKFSGQGVPVLNQTVLLKGVNDQPEVLEELFRHLVKHRIKPHYLFHLDPVQGVRHFETGIECGLAALRHFRTHLSSLAVPQFAIDLPEGGGKVNLQADYTDEFGRYPDIWEQKWIEYTLRQTPQSR